MIRRPPRSTLFPTRRSSDLSRRSSRRILTEKHQRAVVSGELDHVIGLGQHLGDHGTGLGIRSEEHTSELQSPCNLVCRLLLEKKKNNVRNTKQVIQRSSVA